MPKRPALILSILLLTISLMACESEQERKYRAEMDAKEQESKRIEAEMITKQLNEIKLKEEQERKVQEEHDREELVTYNRFINNSLSSGATPYSSCFGVNQSCSEWGCSEIKIKTPRDSDVLVTIKNANKVVRHAYIRSNSTFTFQMPNGTYQTFFYYGTGWNPNKEMESQTCSNLKGGFISEVTFGKDSPQALTNTVLSYELILQKDGNFSTQPSSSSEAF